MSPLAVSPEQIAGRIRLDFPADPKMRISHQSIYAYIKADRAAGGSLWKRLRQSHKRRRKPYGSGPRRCRIPDRVGIEQRPKHVESRKQIGHWEADTMLGRNGRLATCVERKSRYLVIGRMPDGRAAEFNAAAVRCFKKIPSRWRKTITTDSVVVGLMGNRAFLEKVTLRIVRGALGEHGHDLRLKDFVDFQQFR